MRFKGIFLAKKFLRLLILLICVCGLSFVLLINSPVDPVRAHLNSKASASLSLEQRAQIAQFWGLDKPPLERFWSWATGAVQGNFGISMIYNRPVIEILQERFAASVGILVVAWIASGLLGFVLGILAAYRQGSLLDRVIKWYCLLLASSPVFWVALLMLLVFASWLGWFPMALSTPVGVASANVTILDRLHHMALPAATLSIVGGANICLHTRQKMIDVLRSDPVLFAEANGKTGWDIVIQHGLRGVALPALTLQFVSFSELFGGSILVEQVFSYPGLGVAASEAGLKGDMALLLGVVIASAGFVFIGNLIADLLYTMMDPRMRRVKDAETT